MNDAPIQNKELMQVFYSYYKSIDQKNIKPEKYLFRKNKENAITFKLFTFLTQLLKFDAFPQVVSNKTYKKLGNETFYRGVEDVEYLARYLADYDYHFGNGFNQNGIYISDNKDVAALYAKAEKGCVAELKLAPDTRIINNLVLLCQIENALNTQKPEDKNTKALLSIASCDPKFFSYILKDASILAMLFGYDAIKEANAGKVLAVLNRGKVIFSKDELEKITKNSRLYKNGVIDFENKNEEDFLRE